MTTRAASSPWRWFPVWLGAAMGAAFAINGYMVYTAVSTFPGAAGQDGFDLSNGYKRIMATEARQAALGWQVDAAVDAGRHPILHIGTNASTSPAGTSLAGTPLVGTPMADAVIEAEAERPVGPKEATTLSFKPAGDGTYAADRSLFSGQWDILLTIHDHGRTFTGTRRVVVR